MKQHFLTLLISFPDVSPPPLAAGCVIYHHGKWIRHDYCEGYIPVELGLRGVRLGWGLLRQFPSFLDFPEYSVLSKHMLAIAYHVYILQVAPQLSCDNTYQIWMWFKESNRCFCKIKNFACGEINERSLSNPWSHVTYSIREAVSGFDPYFQTNIDNQNEKSWKSFNTLKPYLNN